MDCSVTGTISIIYPLITEFKVKKSKVLKSRNIIWYNGVCLLTRNLYTVIYK